MKTTPHAQAKTVEIDPDLTDMPIGGIDPPGRKPETRLVTAAVENVVEWHRQRASSRALPD